MSNITRNSLVVTGVLAALMAGNVALASDVPTGCAYGRECCVGI
ncbi:peptide ABC transporter substrate-binding protein [Escherichia coli]|nr:peptide ABC transporter substrate-binding protein [Escherichia coli]